MGLFTYRCFSRLVLSVLWVSQKDTNQNTNQDSWYCANNIHGPPAVVKNVQIGHVNTDDKGQTVTIVNSP